MNQSNTTQTRAFGLLALLVVLMGTSVFGDDAQPDEAESPL